MSIGWDGSAPAEEVLAHHSKSFNWAAKLIPREFRSDLATLYAFCRYVDNAVDEAPDDGTALAAADRLLADLHARKSVHPSVARFLGMAARRGMDSEAARELVIGCRGDVGTVRVQDEEELLRYCYRVAGTVGLMICDVVGVHDPSARPFAVDLGLAMQMTNICRDVAEDWARGRVYLPATFVAPQVVEGAIEHQSREAREQVFAAVLRLLDRAERHYRSADRGIRFLPPWVRPGIIAASRTYEAIGAVIRRNGPDGLTRRAWTSPAMKVRATASGLWGLVSDPRYRDSGPAPQHESVLHGALSGLPGANA